MRDPRLYWIWLQQAVRPGCTALDAPFTRLAHPALLYEASAAALRQVGFAGATLQALTNKKLTAAERILRCAQAKGDWLLTPEDACYPAALLEITGKPLVLYGRGELPDLNRLPGIAMVGTRHISESGRQLTCAFAAGLAAGGMVVVSGGAVGGDAAAHWGAIQSGGFTMMVKACSLSEEYPPTNRQLRREILENHGCILTEYPPTVRSKCNFHERNRLLSGLTQGTCVIEAPRNSGSLITAHWAREQGRDVFAVPGNVVTRRNDGCHQLIREGATLVTGAQDILREYWPRFPGILHVEKARQAEELMMVRMTGAASAAWKRPVFTAVCPADATSNAKKLFAILDLTPLPLETVAARAGLPPSTAMAALTELEISGCIGVHAGSQYARK